jgi:hypothetical protein
VIDLEKVKFWLGVISIADHLGDVNDALPGLCEALNLPKPKWSPDFRHYVFPWEFEAFKEEWPQQFEDLEED